MPTYYLRVEAVNMDAFIYDTQDLSTIRGGSLLLLDAAKTVATWPGFKVISSGASIALSAFDAEDDSKAAQARDKVGTALRTDARLQHATFVVDVVPATDSYRADTESLLALNRWGQLEQPSLAVPGDTSRRGPCEKDKLRPAGTENVSASVRVRRDRGRDGVQNLYGDVGALDPGDPEKFVRDFESLSSDPTQGILNGKMAVIYIDGNQFSAHRRTHCKDADRERAWDIGLKSHRREMLRALLHDAASCDDFMNGQRLRFQTLLWGGDDLLWVVPAWRGWWTLQRFYAAAAKWTVNVGTTTVGPLTHGAGMAFCHHTAPIYRIKDLVTRGLAGMAKADDYKTSNKFAYEVLESFDYVGRDLERHRRNRLPPNEPVSNLLLDGERTQEIATAILALTDILPKSKLYDIVQVARAETAGPEDAVRRDRAIEALLQRSDVRSDLPALEVLEKHCGGPVTRWIHLAELWDYIRPHDAPPATAAAAGSPAAAEKGGVA